MKKIVSLVLVMVMALTVLAGCGKPAAPETTAPETTVPETTVAAVPETSALEIMQNIWNSYTENVSEDMQFPVGGGDSENLNMEGPGEFNVAKTEELSSMLNLAADLHTQIDQAASASHMMNANTYTSAVYHVVEGTDVDAFIKTAKEGIESTQWICGFPEQLVVATIYGEYVFVAYGAGELLELVKTELTNAYPEAEFVVDEPLA